MDNIDMTVCRVFDIEPDILLIKLRKGRLTIARFTAIHIRYKRGCGYSELAERYKMTVSSVRHAIKKAEDFLNYDKHYRQKYTLCVELINSGRLPYTSELLRQGVRVWTRSNSKGEVTEGVVTVIMRDTRQFVVETFLDPQYKTCNYVDNGRVNFDFESCRDIEFIES